MLCGAMLVKPVIVSRSDLRGGAARAAWRLHQALRVAGVESTMRVADKASDDPDVIGPATGLGRTLASLRARAGATLLKLQRDDRRTPRSISVLPSRLGVELSRSGADVVNLHWICGEFLAIEDVSSIQKPLVWTLHDTWPIAGAEHIPENASAPRYTAAYSRTSRPAHHAGLDLDAWTWRRKLRSWQVPVRIVAPSHWMAEQARSSALAAEWPVHVIPNPVPTGTYRPWPKAIARQAFDLPEDAPLILFGALGGGSDPRKGYDLLASALPLIGEAVPDAHAIVFGQSAPQQRSASGLPTHYVGHLHDDVSLAFLYSAADVVVVPSRIDNLPQTATEAQSCGVPVVAFDTGGLADAVEHDRTGLLVDAFSVENLASAIVALLGDDEKRQSFGSAARARAERLWSSQVAADQYIACFRKALDVAT